jgi:hypothetical protein
LAAKSRVDTIMKMPASDLALMRPCFQTFSCAADGPDMAQAAANAANIAVRIAGSSCLVAPYGVYSAQ